MGQTSLRSCNPAREIHRISGVLDGIQRLLRRHWNEEDPHDRDAGLLLLANTLSESVRQLDDIGVQVEAAGRGAAA